MKSDQGNAGVRSGGWEDEGMRSEGAYVEAYVEVTAHQECDDQHHDNRGQEPQWVQDC